MVFKRGTNLHVLDGVVATVKVTAEACGRGPFHAGKINVVDQLVVCPFVHLEQILGSGDLYDVVHLEIHHVVFLGRSGNGLGIGDAEVAVGNGRYLIIVISAASVIAQRDQKCVLIQNDDLIRVICDLVVPGMVIADRDAVDVVSGLVGKSHVKTDKLGGVRIVYQVTVGVHYADAFHDQLTVDKYGSDVIFS